MRLNLFATVTLTIIVALISCKDREQPPSGFINEYKTNSGKTIIISETHPDGKSISNIRINTRDFEYNFSEEFFDKDPITDVFIADLDENGFDEVYIITTSKGSGNYGTVLGFASNRDKSLSMINFPDIQYNIEFSQVYKGYDSFSIENKELVRTFPVFNEGDKGQNATGGKCKINYRLYPGEAMWQLKIENSEMLSNQQ